MFGLGTGFGSILGAILGGASHRYAALQRAEYERRSAEMRREQEASAILDAEYEVIEPLSLPKP